LSFGTERALIRRSAAQTMGGLARLVAINANAIDHSCDGAGCTSKSSCNDLHGEVIEMVAGQGYTLFVLDLLNGTTDKAHQYAVFYLDT
jgi:hypothetical protein